MPDLDVIVKSLRRCSDMTICPDDCFYRKYAPDCIEKLHRDAIALLKEQNELLKQQAELLKEQEAKKVIESTNMYTGLPITHCPKCGVSIDRYLHGRQHEGQINHCPFCGQAVKWE